MAQFPLPPSVVCRDDVEEDVLDLLLDHKYQIHLKHGGLVHGEGLLAAEDVDPDISRNCRNQLPQ